ncbi:MAG: dynamin family protein, partial [Myxococcota bacterium]|nr:dynamin family protein [Myxococcota bacterium]
AAGDKSPDVSVRRAEARLLRGDARGAKKWLESGEATPTDGRAALARGRALSALADPDAFVPLLRAMVLDQAGASEALAAALARVPSDPQVRARVRSVVDAKGEQDHARWRAAFASAEGRRDIARLALAEALDAGDTAAARPLLEAAIDDRDARDVDAALRRLPADGDDGLLGDARRVAHAAGQLEASPAGALDALRAVAHPRLLSWAEALASSVASRWIPPSGALAAWPHLLDRLHWHARAAGDLESVAAVADLAAERSRPVRLAIVGEFNAGKSTFINALIGADVAPTGVLPTTATMHHLRWAPDRIARISFVAGHEPRERTLPLDEVRGTLKSLDATTIRRVEILMPLPFLVRVEIIDTPGFNAPDVNHTRVALAALEEADVAIWLVDATQAMKQSERAVLEDAKRARLPVQILVNKADRLAPADLARVLREVNVALQETGIESWAPPLALSARRALAGKLGDAKALDDSGWAEVQSLLEERIVARSDELKERALRRRASRIVARLSSEALSEAERQKRENDVDAARAELLAHAAAQIERDAGAQAEIVARSLEATARAYQRDMALVFVGRDRASAMRDQVLSRYRVERAAEALAFPLARVLSALAPEVELAAVQLVSLTRALVRATVAAAPTGDPDEWLPPLARTSVDTLVEQLFTLSSAPRPSSDAAGIARELRVFAEALA